MRVISESEKQQLLAASTPRVDAARRRPPAQPPLSMPDYLRQVEQFARLFPQTPRPFARGDHWKL